MSRGKGFGEVRKYGRGSFGARYVNPIQPVTPAGSPNRIRSPHTFRTRTEARAWLDRVHGEIMAGKWVSPEEEERRRKEAERTARRNSVTFETYGEKWLTRFERNKRRATSTKRGYRSHFDNQLKPTFGALPLREVSKAEITAWASTPTQSPRARQEAYELLRTMLGDAAEDGLIEDSPCTPRISGRVRDLIASNATQTKNLHKRQSLEPSEIGPFLEALSEPYRRLARFLIFSGLRRGEALALKGADIKDNGDGTVTVTVTKALKGMQVAHPEISRPKTAAGVRIQVVAGPVARETLEAARKAGPDGLIFPNPNRPGYMSPRTILDKFKAASEKALGRPVVAHELRNTYSTLTDSAGVSATARQHALGHSSPQQTFDYSRQTREQATASALTLATYLEGEVADVADIDRYRKEKQA